MTYLGPRGVWCGVRRCRSGFWWCRTPSHQDCWYRDGREQLLPADRWFGGCRGGGQFVCHRLVVYVAALRRRWLRWGPRRRRTRRSSPTAVSTGRRMRCTSCRPVRMLWWAYNDALVPVLGWLAPAMLVAGWCWSLFGPSGSARRHPSEAAQLGATSNSAPQRDANLAKRSLGGKIAVAGGPPRGRVRPGYRARRPSGPVAHLTWRKVPTSSKPGRRVAHGTSFSGKMEWMDQRPALVASAMRVSRSLPPTPRPLAAGHDRVLDHAVEDFALASWGCCDPAEDLAGGFVLGDEGQFR